MPNDFMLGDYYLTNAVIIVGANIFFSACIYWFINVMIDMVIYYSSVYWNYMFYTMMDISLAASFLRTFTNWGCSSLKVNILIVKAWVCLVIILVSIHLSCGIEILVIKVKVYFLIIKHNYLSFLMIFYV